MGHNVDARWRLTESVRAGIDPELVSAFATLALRDDDESRDGDATRTLDDRMGAKPPRRVAEPPETARSASRGAQRSDTPLG